jgi:hypothetical protein
MRVVSSIDIDRAWTVRQLIDHLVKDTNWKKFEDMTVIIDDKVGFLIELKVVKLDDV